MIALSCQTCKVSVTQAWLRGTPMVSEVPRPVVPCSAGAG